MSEILENGKKTAEIGILRLSYGLNDFAGDGGDNIYMMWGLYPLLRRIRHQGTFPSLPLLRRHFLRFHCGNEAGSLPGRLELWGVSRANLFMSREY